MTERTIFMEALAQETPAQRSAYLGQACGGDAALRQRVEALLASHDQAGNFLGMPVPQRLAEKLAAPGGRRETPGKPPAAAEGPGPSNDETAGPRPGTEGPGSRIGPYKLLEQVGEGGMGTVWLAQQQEPVKRLVAVKLIKSGMDSKQVLARFEAERQAVALMDHPNIAKVLDAGATPDGQPFFVMELVKGVPITRYCDEHRLTPRQRLELFVPVCEAIQHAHQKGIIHRDLKPSNVLVALYDEHPVPKVIDFGVAKATGQQLTAQTLHTGLGAVVGTVEYMSPEQASFNQLDVDTRSDIYSLGVLLYELLAGSPPFSRKELEKVGMVEMLRVIREQEPRKPSAKLSTADGLSALAANRGTEPKRLAALVRGELDWVVMKALDKDRNRRYETAYGFAADVERYLADQPVLAGPPSTRYRLRKFLRRNRGVVLAASLVLLMLLGGIVGTTVGLVQAQASAEQATHAAGQAATERDAAEKARGDEGKARVRESIQRKLAELGEATAKQQLATISRDRFALQLAYVGAVQDSDPARGRQLLEDETRCPPGLRDFTWKLFHGLCQRQRLGLSGEAGGVTFSPDGQLLATAGADGKIRLWDPAAGKELAVLAGHKGPVLAVAFAPDGKLLASGGADSTVRLWDVLARKERAVCTGHTGGVQSVSFSSDGLDLASSSTNDTAIVWEVAAAKRRITLKATEPILQIAFCPTPGSRLLAWASGKDVTLRDLETGKDRVLRGHKDRVTSLAFDASGKRLGTGGWVLDPTIRLWDVASGAELVVLRGQKNHVQTLALAGDIVASAAEGDANLPTEVRLWDVRTGQTRTVLKVPTDSVLSVAFSPDGVTLATAGCGPLQGASPVLLWNVAPGPERATIAPLGKPQLWCVAFSPDSKTLAAEGAGGTVELWDVSTGRKRATLPGAESRLTALAFAPAGDRLVACANEGIWWWDLTTGKVDAAMAVGTLYVACAPDGKTWASLGIGPRPELRLWDLATRLEHWRVVPHADLVTCLAYSPDSKTLATGSRDKTVKLWDVATGRHLTTLKGHQREVLAVAFSADGKSLASASADRTVMVWDLATARVEVTLKGHTETVRSVAFSPDGRTLATGGQDKTVKLWDPVTGVERASFLRHAGPVVWVTFAPDGRTLASVGGVSTVKLWDAPPFPK